MLAIYEDSKTSAASLDSDAYIELNKRLHRTIYDGARNEYLSQLIRQTRKRMAFYHASSLYQKARLERSWQEHGHVVHAIRDGDAEAARAAMRDHILSGGRVYADLVAALKRNTQDTAES